MSRVRRIFIIFVLGLLLAGCSNSSGLPEKEDNPPSGQEATQQSQEKASQQSQDNEKQGIEEESNKGSEDGGYPELKTDTGRYSGRIDSNFIEIKISGVPEQIAAREFLLSEELKTTFANLNLQEGQEIRIKYATDKNDQRIIMEISRL